MRTTNSATQRRKGMVKSTRSTSALIIGPTQHAVIVVAIVAPVVLLTASFELRSFRDYVKRFNVLLTF
jgi:hypothetical protein